MQGIKEFVYISKEIQSIHKKNIPLQIVYGIFTALYATVGLYFPKWIINEVLQQGSPEKVILLTGFMAGSVLAVKFVTIMIETYNSDNNSRNIAVMRYRVREKRARLGYWREDDSGQQDRQERAYRAVYQLSVLSCSVYTGVPSSVLRIIVTCYYLVHVDYVCIIILLCSTVLVYAINGRAGTALHGINSADSRNNRKKGVSDHLAFQSSEAKQIRVGGMQTYLLQKYHEVVSGTVEAEEKRQRVIWKRNTFLSLIDVGQKACIYIFLLYRYFSGRASAADFVIAIPMITAFIHAVREGIENLSRLQNLSLYVRDYKDYMEEAEQNGALAMPGKIQSIVFENVSFIYPNTATYALKEINVSIAAGTKGIIVGENGSGKTTFVKLLLGLYEPSEGRITVNGTDISNIDKKEYWKRISTVFQDFFIFNYSLMDNLCCGADIDGETVNNMLHYMDGDAILQKVNGNLDSYVTRQLKEDGIELSGGERQKLAICRALLKNAEIGIMDEPTAALDPISEIALFDKFLRFNKIETKLFISHRMSIARKCDTIIVFENGRIVEEGSHEVLKERKGCYWQMLEKQKKMF